MGKCVGTNSFVLTCTVYVVLIITASKIDNL